MLPPAFVDYALRDARADGVLIAGCRECDCQYRLGTQWTGQRMTRERVPHLRRRVPLVRIELCWAAAEDEKTARAALSSLQLRIAALPREHFEDDEEEQRRAQ
jgi:coenzyme F420-reducing hydrogenase delta subunit